MSTGRPLVLVLGALAACGDSDDPTWDDPEGRCLVVVASDDRVEELDARMYGPGIPADLVMRADGVVGAVWTYDYDEAGRLIAQEADFARAPDGVLDGVIDQRRELAHTADEVVETFRDPSGQAAEAVRWRLNPDGWVREYRATGSSRTFQVTTAGWLDQVDESGIDPEAGEFARREEYERTTEDLLARRTTTDSRSAPVVVDFTHTFEADGRHVIRSTLSSKVYGYRRDAGGRLIEAAVDDDGDGTDNWIVDLFYAADGGLTVTGRRDGNTFRTTSFSAGCAMEPQGPWAPRGEPRPGPRWQFALPSMPEPY